MRDRTSSRAISAVVALAVLVAVAFIARALRRRFSGRGVSPDPPSVQRNHDDVEVVRSDGSWRSRGSLGSARALGSIGSFCSVGCIGSSFSIGSIGSSFSIGSIGSIASIGSIGSMVSVGSVFSVAGFFTSFSMGNNYKRDVGRGLALMT